MGQRSWLRLGASSWVAAAVGLLPAHPAHLPTTLVVGQVKTVGALIRTEQGPADAGFGSGVATSATTTVVGSPSADSVSIYTKKRGRWPTKPTVILTDPGTSNAVDFGESVALSGSVLVVGAFATDNIRGAAYIYVKGSAGWPTTPTATLDDPDPTPSSQDLFGIAVATSGTTVAVGAVGYGGFYGAAYLYDVGSAGWPTTPSQTLVDPSPEGGSFGTSVALSADTLAVGADGTDGGQGAAYIYQEGTTGWPSSPTVDLADPAAANDDYFGASVALSPATLVIGANGTDSSAGATYLYTEKQSGWPLSPTAALLDPAGSAADQFGLFAAASGGTILIGAFNKSSSDGNAYLYTRRSGAWPTAPTRTLDDPGESADAFGTAVAVSRGVAVVGAWKTDADAGAAYIYKG